jgi:uncharacterized protein (DUF3084 family)
VTWLVGLVLLLVVLAGVIAYLGDRLGTLVGRRRLSLFGARPRLTGQIVGVMAGILIMLTTLGVLSIAARSATETLLSAQRTAQELNRTQQLLQQASQQLEQATQLRQVAENDAELARAAMQAAEDEVAFLEASIGQLQDQIGSLGEQGLQLRAENELLQGQSSALHERNEQLASENTALLEQNSGLTDLNASLRQRIQETNEHARQLEANLDILEMQVEDNSRRLSELQDEFDQIADGEVTYRKDDLIYSGLITAENAAEARDALAAYVRAANEVTAQRGAGEVKLSAEQFDSLASLIAQSPGEIVIALISPRNQMRSALLEVSIEAYENTLVVERGQLITSRPLHLGTLEQPASQSDIRSAVLELVRTTRNGLTRAGLFSAHAPSFTMNEEAFISQLQQLNGPVTVGVAAVEDVYRSGPALLEFLILN